MTGIFMGSANRTDDTDAQNQRARVTVNVEAVEKPSSRATIPLRAVAVVLMRSTVALRRCERYRLNVEAPRASPVSFLSLRIAVMRQLLDVVHQAEELPLRVDFLSAA